jgi:trimethylamine--corrinoid protein Co-methyltransferase
MARGGMEMGGMLRNDMETKDDRSRRITFRMLGEAQLETFHQAALQVLSEVGVLINEPYTLGLLEEAGCRTEADLAFIPGPLVEDAISSAPSAVSIYDRRGKPAMHLGGYQTYFGTGSDLLYRIDTITGERRRAILSDVEQAAAIVHALPNIDFVMSFALPSDVPPMSSDRYSFRAMVQNTTKPIVFTSWDLMGTQHIVEMAEAIVGGEAELQTTPFIINYVEPTSPLQHSREALEKLIFMAKRGLPTLYVPGMVGGGSAPITPAGMVVQGMAESLTGLVITQLVRRGTPFIWGAGGGPMDMKTMVSPFLTPEGISCDIAWTEIAHHLYKLPVWGTSGASDAKQPDMQAAAEATMMLVFSALSGANLIHDVGYLESGLSGSLEMLLLADEVIGAVRKLLAGLQVNSGSLALEAIKGVSPGGNYLASEHTLANFRDNWYPRWFDHGNFDAWRARGGQSLRERLRASALELLEAHQAEPLSSQVSRTLDTIVARARHA